MERRGDGREGADGQQRGRAVGQRGGAASSHKGAQTEGRGEGTVETVRARAAEGEGTGRAAGGISTGAEQGQWW